MEIREIAPGVDSTVDTAKSDISRVLWIMAITAGAGISNVFYVQSMVDLIGSSLAMRPAMLGLVPASTIGGYALGLFFLVRSATASIEDGSSCCSWGLSSCLC